MGRARNQNNDPSAILTEQLSGGAAVDLAGNDQTLTTLSGDGSLSLGSAALTVGAGDGSSAFASVIGGSGSLVKDGAGTLVLNGGNTYSGGTTVAAGSLAGTSTSLQGNIVNNGLVVFDQSFDGTYAGSTNGTGILQKAGSGTLTVTGTHTHTGGTLVGTAANLGGTILNEASVVFGGDADGLFQGTLAGGGTFGKQGAGTLFVTGNHSHTGETSLVSDQWSEYDDEVDIRSYTLDWLIGLRRASFTRRGFIEAGADALSLLLPEQTLTLRQTNVQMHLWRHEGDFRPFFEVLYRREMTDGRTTTELEFPCVPDSRFFVDGLPAPKNIVNARGGPAG